ncbi:MAG: hypothetical protein ACKVOM_00950 [Ferruginibacter sp.]
MDTILFNNKEFPVREIEHPEFGLILISVNSLNELLLREDGSYFSDEAETVDEMFFYYVNDNEIKLPENALINLLLMEVL